MSVNRTIIIGAGQAGAQAAISLRQFGYDGEIHLIGEEPAPPYQRPPLSKAYLKGSLDRERLFIKPETFYAEKDISLHMSKRVASVNSEAQSVELSDGSELTYTSLVFATGSRPRKLPVPGSDLDNVLDLRTLSDVDSLKPLVGTGKSAVIIGAGYIGLEAAAVMIELGMNVTVIELAPRVLARVTSPIMSDFYHGLHTKNGVDIRLETSVSAINGTTAVESVTLNTGETLAADIVLAGIGILPNEEIASSGGIDCENGILVNEQAMTSVPNVYAIGDCARRPLVHYGRVSRLESVHNAIEQGKIAAAHITEKAHPKEDVPWFWSDQYDVKLQIAGLSEGHDETVVRGSLEENKFSVFYFKGEKLVAVDAVNSAPEFMTAKKLILNRSDVSQNDIRNPNITMKDLMAKA